jgi:hypothetical protein
MARCQHQWEETSRSYTPPTPGSSVKTATRDLAEKMLFGLTVIEQQCTKCGLLTHHNVAGNTVRRR